MVRRLASNPGPGVAEFNTADATLWFLHAVDRHVAVTGDLDLGASPLDALAGVIGHQVAGTRHGIRAGSPPTACSPRASKAWR